jgi:hypothetical protein
MKNLKTKLSYAFYTLLVAFLMVGCNPEGSDNDVNPEKTYKVIEIDGCEYIYISCRPWSDAMSLAHKGNCKNH